jgi:uncharacterized protein YlxP (DUF503 family)
VIVGRLRVELSLPGNRCLKGKRRVVKGLMDRVRREFNVAIAEVARQDSHQHAVLGVAAVANERRHVDAVLAAVVRRLAADEDAVLGDYDVEMG